LDTENKSRGSLTRFFGGQVPKVNIHTPAGLDAFVDELTDGPPVVLADVRRARSAAVNGSAASATHTFYSEAHLSQQNE
jgi:hypothetical protein